MMALMPKNDNDPKQCFYFQAGTFEGRLKVDLGSVLAVSQVDTYSWHRATRGPQVYVLFGSDGTASGFDPRRRSDAIRRLVDGRGSLRSTRGRPRDCRAGGMRWGCRAHRERSGNSVICCSRSIPLKLSMRSGTLSMGRLVWRRGSRLRDQLRAALSGSIA